MDTGSTEQSSMVKQKKCHDHKLLLERDATIFLLLSRCSISSPILPYGVLKCEGLLRQKKGCDAL